MKIRGVKPDFWIDENVVEVSYPARLLFIGLWMLACDNGHVEDSPKRIKMALFAADNVDVADLLDELVGQGLIVRAGGWITVPHLAQHQHIDTRYFLTCKRDDCTKPAVATPGRTPRRTPATPGAHRAHTVGTVRPHDDSDSDSEKDSSADADATLDPFTTWYAAYPRREGRGQALRAFRAALKKTDAQTLTAALAAQLPRLVAVSDRRFIPLPATWLNGERWLDEPPVDAWTPRADYPEDLIS